MVTLLLRCVYRLCTSSCYKDIQIFPYRTLMQLLLLRSVKDELSTCTRKEEKDLIIRYYNGYPKIVVQCFPYVSLN